MNYTDLITRLRNATALPMLQSLCNEAADAIEELSKIAEQYLEEKENELGRLARDASLKAQRDYLLSAKGGIR